MVSNPAWRRGAGDFAQTVRGWLFRPDADAMMALAIFLDAHAVAGDASLLGSVRDEVDRLIAVDDTLLGRFAAAIDAFPEEAVTWWHRLPLIGEHDKAPLDLKKAGIFPIVHGVRSLALREHVSATGTAERLDALVAAGRLTAQLAAEIVESLRFLMTMKLKAGLAELDADRPVGGGVRTAG